MMATTAAETVGRGRTPGSPTAAVVDHAPSVTPARYRRPPVSFQGLFGVAAADVLSSMDEAGDDVPEGAPLHPIDIDGVGFRRRCVVVPIDDPFGSGGCVQAICTVCISAGVPRRRRGIHVSRINQAIAEISARGHRDIAAYASTVARAVAESQYGRAQVRVHGRIPYVEEVQVDPTGRCKPSLEHLHVIARHAAHGGIETSDLGLRVTHLIACPCVQVTYRHATLFGTPSPDTAAARTANLMTHSQRCVTSVVVCGVRQPGRVVELLAALDSVLFRTSNTLPRDAELACVFRAHRAPQFIEDALRSAVVAVADAWPAPASFRYVKGHSRSLESIHEHDLTASLTLCRSRLRVSAPGGRSR